MATSEKLLNSRTQQKHDIEANWIKAENFIPKAGEIIVYDAETGNDALPENRNYHIDYVRIKIGDGVTNINSLLFTGMYVIDNGNGQIIFKY